MAEAGLTALIANAALLIAVAAILDLVVRRGPWSERASGPWLVGLVLGGVAVLVMLVPFRMQEGVVYDVRSVVLGLGGLYFGTVPAVVATAVAAAFRGWLGGAGVVPGVATLVVSAALGMGWRRWRPVGRAARGWRELLAFGVVVHLFVAALQLALPRPLVGRFLIEVAPAMLLLFPLLTVLTGLLLERRVVAARTMARLQESEARFRAMFENGHAIVLLVDPSDWRIVDANPAAAMYYGWSRDQLVRMRVDQIAPLTPAAFRAALERGKERGGHGFAFRHRRADGQDRAVEVFTGPVHDGDRDLVYALIVDVHDRRRAEAERVSRAAEVVAAQAEDLARQRRARVALLNLADDAFEARRRLEAAHRDLSASEARYRSLFHANPQPMWVYDLATYAFLEVNDAAIQRYGYGRDEFLAMTLVDIRPPEDVPRLLAKLARPQPVIAMDDGWRHRTKAGDLLQVAVHSHAIEFEGRPARLVQVHDVTEQRRAEAAMRESEERLRTLVEYAPAALAMLDRDLRFVAVSRRWLADNAPDEGEILGRGIVEFLPQAQERWHEAARRALGGEVQRHEADRVVHPGGRVQWLRWEARPWLRSDESVGGIVIFTEDITEVVHAREEVTKLSQAVEQSPESVLITDLEGRIEYVNQAFVEASGYTRQELMGQNPRMLQSGRTPPETFRELWSSLTSGQVWGGELVNRRKNGEEYVEHAIISPLAGPHGETAHYVAVKADVTEQRRAADELDRYRNHLEELVVQRTTELEEARARAVAASEAKSAFLANMSHEIRTPINSVLGLTHLLLQDDPTPPQADRLRKVRGAAAHLLAIVSDILDLAKIEAGKMSVQERDFHLSAVLDHVGSIVAQSAHDKGLLLEVDGDAVPAWLRGDPVRLRQALLNLAGNAIKYTERGTVRICASLLDEAAEGLRIRFEVVDTGIGIPADFLPRLFDAFEQADEWRAPAQAGTGLGLPIVKRLAELMGGTVGVESEEGYGTRIWFDVTLQRGRRPAVAMEDPELPVEEPSLTFEGARVLLVEDHDVNREVATEVLRGFGIEVWGAENGQVAVELAARHEFDMVLMDVQMPVLGGLEATRAIRAMAGYAQVPILAMTANVFEEDRQACFAAGMDDFVGKPVDPGVLRAAVKKWVLRYRDRRGVAPLSPTADDAGQAAPRGGVASSVDESPKLPEALVWPGLDGRTAMEALGGDVARYVALLRRFLAAHAGDARRLTHDLSAGDVKAAQLRAHGLKGVAGTLGATSLHAAADELDSALREGGDPDAAVEAVRHELDELERRIAGIPDGREGRCPGAADGGRAVLARLRALLATDDPSVLEAHRAGRDALRALMGEEAEALGAEIQAFDFGPARERIDRWASSEQARRSGSAR